MHLLLRQLLAMEALQVMPSLLQTLNEHWLDLLLGVGIPAGKVRSLDDVYEWEQTRSQGLLVDVEHPAYGQLTLAGSPIRFEDNPFSGAREQHRPPPLLDEHGAAIREWLEP